MSPIFAPPEFEILPMQLDDCPAAAILHAQRFLRGWNDGELHALLVQEAVFGFVCRRAGSKKSALDGFVLARAAAGEAEILSIGVAAKAVRRGLGWRLMRAALDEAALRSADSMFLEVDENNQAALNLYNRLGFQQVGARGSYYASGSGKKSAALVMRRELR